MNSVMQNLTWSQWVATCRNMVAANRGAEYPAEFESSCQKNREQWVEFYRNGLTPRQAMERVNNRRIR